MITTLKDFTVTHDYSFYMTPYRYYDPVAKQGLSIVHESSTGQLVHADAVLPIKALLSIVRTGHSVMLLYKGHTGQTLTTSSSAVALDLEIWLKAYVTLKVVDSLCENYSEFKTLTASQLSARVECLYAPSDESKVADVLIVECGMSRERFDIKHSKARLRFLQECLTSSTMY